jgi:hypothetical protein
MSYRHTLEAITESLHEIEDLIIRFPGEGDIPSIELDLALQKMRNIYELLLALKNVPAAIETQRGSDTAPAAIIIDPPLGTDTAAVPVAPDDRKGYPYVTPESKPAGIAADDRKGHPYGTTESKPADAAPDDRKGHPFVAAESQPAAAPDDRKGHPYGTAESQPASGVAPSVIPPAPASASSAQILSDRFKGRTTLHETFHPSSSTIAQARPVENLMSAIGINDRFTFIRELFNGDAPLYEQTIHILNDAANFNEAYNFMIQHFDWNMDSDTVQLLLEIIRRKFITGRHE